MRTRIHVNQHVIRRNAKTGSNDPPLTVKDYRQNRLADDVEIVDASSTVVARIVYRPEAPLDCGARVWVETDLEVRAKAA